MEEFYVPNSKCRYEVAKQDLDVNTHENIQHYCQRMVFKNEDNS